MEFITALAAAVAAWFAGGLVSDLFGAAASAVAARKNLEAYERMAKMEMEREKQEANER